VCEEKMCEERKKERKKDLRNWCVRRRCVKKERKSEAILVFEKRGCGNSELLRGK
jgi:hypothetical protein